MDKLFLWNFTLAHLIQLQPPARPGEHLVRAHRGAPGTAPPANLLAQVRGGGLELAHAQLYAGLQEELQLCSLCEHTTAVCSNNQQY